MIVLNVASSIVDRPFSDHPVLAGSIRLWQPGEVRPLAPEGSNLIAALLPEQGLQVIDLSQEDSAFPTVAGSSLGVTDTRIVAGDDFLMGKLGYRIDSLGKLHRLGQVQVKDCDVQWARPFGDKLLVSTSDCGLLVLAGPEAVWSVYLPVVSQ